jgi:hypothetical protein
MGIGAVTLAPLFMYWISSNPHTEAIDYIFAGVKGTVAGGFGGMLGGLIPAGAMKIFTPRKAVKDGDESMRKAQDAIISGIETSTGRLLSEEAVASIREGDSTQVVRALQRMFCDVMLEPADATSAALSQVRVEVPADESADESADEEMAAAEAEEAATAAEAAAPDTARNR